MTKPSKQIIEGVLALPFSLGLASEVAGTVTSVKIGGVDFEVEVPSIEGGDSQRRPRLLPPHVQSVRDDINWPEYLHDPWAWGAVSAWHENGSVEGVSKIDIGYVLVRKEFSKASDTKESATNLEALRDTLFRSLDRWTSLFMDWLEVGSRKVLQDTRPTFQEEGKGLRAWGNDGSSYVTLRSSKPIYATGDISDGLSLNTWQRALRLAGLNDVPPAEYILLRDARINILSGDFRRSVLDAATGAEMALTRLLDANLASSLPVVSELVKERWGQIGGLVRALRKLGVDLPSNIENTGLATPRNRAIHKGTAPSKDEATQSISIAEQVIEMALPLATIFR